MASVAQGAVVLADGYDLSCYLKSVEVQANMDVLDSTTLCTTNARQYTAGLVEHSVSGEGFFAYNATTDSLGPDYGYNAELSASATRLITIGRNGGTLGYDAVLMNTRQSSYNIQETVGDLIMTTFEAKASDESSLDDFASGGVFLLYQSVTGTVNGTGHDDGAGATTGWLAHLHVTADDFTSMVVKVQHSTDNSSWSDLITFATVSGVGAEQKIDTSTSVSRYIRAAVTTFSGTSASVAVAIKTGYTG